MYYTITISHSYSHSDYFKPEKKITGKNSYRAYYTEERANSALKKLIDFYKAYLLKCSTLEVVLINFTTHSVVSDKTKLFLIYYQKKQDNQVCILGIEL